MLVMLVALWATINESAAIHTLLHFLFAHLHYSYSLHFMDVHPYLPFSVLGEGVGHPTDARIERQLTGWYLGLGFGSIHRIFLSDARTGLRAVRVHSNLILRLWTHLLEIYAGRPTTMCLRSAVCLAHLVVVTMLQCAGWQMQAAGARRVCVLFPLFRVCSQRLDESNKYC